MTQSVAWRLHLRRVAAAGTPDVLLLLYDELLIRLRSQRAAYQLGAQPA